MEKWGRNGEKCLWKRKQNVKKTGGFYDIVRVGIYGEVRHMMEYFFMGGFEIMFLMVFVLIFGMILVMIVRGIGEWGKKNRSPRLDVSATVVSKRTHTMRNQNHTSSSSYYVTFQVESGDRMELRLGGREYGLLAEGDKGKLHFQGTRYLGFDRSW